MDIRKSLGQKETVEGSNPNYRIKPFDEIEKIGFLEEDKFVWKILYNGQEVLVFKGKETSFIPHSQSEFDAVSSSWFKPRISIRINSADNSNPNLKGIVGYEIIHDKSVPAEFMEPMVFHELREIEFILAAESEPHNRAMNDEVAYVAKYFDADYQRRFEEFSAEYRAKAENKAKSEKVD